MSIKRVLVTGAAGSPGMNFIQSLKEAPEPFEIVAVDCNRWHLEWIDVPKRFQVPTCDSPNYIETLNSIIDGEGIDLVHPQPDVEVKVISEHRDQLKAKTFLPSIDTINTLQDKELAGKKWEAAGIRQNPTIIINDFDDIVHAAETLKLPFWMRSTMGAGARGSTLVENIETAFHWLQYWRSRNCKWSFIAEEYLPGKDYAWQSLWHKGKLITSQGRERLEYIYPHLAPSGRTGTPTVAVTCHNEAVNDIATRCVRAIDPEATGVFSVDLRENKHGEPIPTEINAGRFFTTSLFFTRAGLNIPYLYTKLALGESIPETIPYNSVQEGLYWIRHIDCEAALVPQATLDQDLTWQKSPQTIAA